MNCLQSLIPVSPELEEGLARLEPFVTAPSPSRTGRISCEDVVGSMAVAILSLIGSNKKNRPKNADILTARCAAVLTTVLETLARDEAQREKNGELRTVKLLLEELRTAWRNFTAGSDTMGLCRISNKLLRELGYDNNDLNAPALTWQADWTPFVVPKVNPVRAGKN